MDSVLDKTGLTYLWGKIKAMFATKQEVQVQVQNAKLEAITGNVPWFDIAEDLSDYEIVYDYPPDDSVYGGAVVKYNVATMEFLLFDAINGICYAMWDAVDVYSSSSAYTREDNGVIIPKLYFSYAEGVMYCMDGNNLFPLQPRVQSDWNATSGDTAILNKPTIPDTSNLATKDEVADVSKGCTRISLAGAANTMVSVRFYGVCAGHTYRLYIQRPSVDMTGVTYTTSSYVMLQIMRRDKSGNKMPSGTDIVNVGCDKKSEPLAAYYDIPIDASMTEIDHIQVAMRAADGWVQWFQLEDITESVNDKGYIPNISLIGTGNDIAYSAFYKGVKGGRKYRILIKTPDIDMSGVTNTNSRLIIYLVNLATMVVGTTSQIVRWNKADTLPNYYDIDVPDDGVDYALHYCMRATAGVEQVLEVVDITDYEYGGDIVNNEVTTTWTSGKAIYATTGELNNATYYNASDYIYIPNNTISIRLMALCLKPGASGNANMGLAFYDSSKTYISGIPREVYDHGGNDSFGIADRTYSNIPDKAKYFRTTCVSSTNNWYCYLQSVGDQGARDVASSAYALASTALQASTIWTGTQTQYDALTSDQKSNIIAFITEE